MAADQLILPDAVFQLPITGLRDGRKGVVVSHAIVLDDEFTRAVLAPHRWQLTGFGYVKRDLPRPARRVVCLHRVVCEHYHGPISPGLKVDHIDRNPLNNLPNNLRAVTQSINISNRGKQRNNTSGYVGVYWHRAAGKWAANIMARRKHIHLGLFANALDAAAAVNRAYELYFPNVQVPNLLE